MDNFINFKYEKQINLINDTLRDSCTKVELENMDSLHRNDLANKIKSI